MVPTEQYKFIHVFIVFPCCSMSCLETNIDITILNIEREVQVSKDIYYYSYYHPDQHL